MNTVNVIVRNRKLLSTKADSRDQADSRRLSLFRKFQRRISSAADPINTSTTKTRNGTPSDDRANEWTDEITPVRVTKVPSTIRQNVRTIRIMFQTLNIP